LKGGAGALTRREASARARSRGRTVVAWRDELDAQRRGLQAGVAKAVASGDAVTKTVAQLAFDLGVEQDWEYVMMRQPSDDVAFAGAAASSGASPEDGSGGGSSFAPITVGGGGLRAGGGKRDDSRWSCNRQAPRCRRRIAAAAPAVVYHGCCRRSAHRSRWRARAGPASKLVPPPRETERPAFEPPAMLFLTPLMPVPRSLTRRRLTATLQRWPSGLLTHGRSITFGHDWTHLPLIHSLLVSSLDLRRTGTLPRAW